MSDTLTFELVSPEKLLLSGEAEIVTVPGADGDMGIMANHSAVMTSLRPGIIGVKMKDGTENEFFVRGGFADVTPQGVTILAEYSIPRSELTREVFEAQKQKAQEEYDAHHAAGNEDKKFASRSYLDQLNHLEPTLLPA